MDNLHNGQKERNRLLQLERASQISRTTKFGGEML